MSLKTAMEIGERGERTMRNLAAAQTGERLTYSPTFNDLNCRHCGVGLDGHVMDTGVLFCAEWALRERWGR